MRNRQEDIFGIANMTSISPQCSLALSEANNLRLFPIVQQIGNCIKAMCNDHPHYFHCRKLKLHKTVKLLTD